MELTQASVWKVESAESQSIELGKSCLPSARAPPTTLPDFLPCGWARLEPSWGHGAQRGEVWGERTAGLLPPCSSFTRGSGLEAIFNSGPPRIKSPHHLPTALFSIPTATLLWGMLCPCRWVSRGRGRRGRAGPGVCPILGLVRKTRLSSSSYILQGHVTTLTSAWGVSDIPEVRGGHEA